MKAILVIMLLSLPVLAALPKFPARSAAVVVPVGETITNAWQNPGNLYMSSNGIVWWKVGEGTNEGWNTNITKGLFLPCYLKVTSYYPTNTQEPGSDQISVARDNVYYFYSLVGPKQRNRDKKKKHKSHGAISSMVITVAPRPKLAPSVSVALRFTYRAPPVSTVACRL